MSRVPETDVTALNADERRIYDAITGPRGGLGGPFAAWFAVPEIAERVNDLVDRLRFGSTLDKRVYELITLLVAHEWSADFIWRAHEKAALAAGIAPDVVAAIAHDTEPVFGTDGERLAFELTRALLASHHVPDELFERARHHFGMAGLVELVTVIGYYGMNAAILRTFDVR